MFNFAKNLFLRRKFGWWGIALPVLWRNREKILSTVSRGAKKVGISTSRRNGSDKKAA